MQKEKSNKHVARIALRSLLSPFAPALARVHFFPPLSPHLARLSPLSSIISLSRIHSCIVPPFESVFAFECRRTFFLPKLFPVSVGSQCDSRSAHAQLRGAAFSASSSLAAHARARLVSSVPLR